ncbi:hypothetical protein AMATHDRAFT_46331 [Amanita thiersii Skay4041]|uniref:Glyoxalase-like domain-containing protein n=1 Tax=Amanita thiersii Skay4041 TaxID=703135 RepID=A0A2A9NX82_9AGAR|nr:hypothetical protein AMATHDRAFT_46331 [Amanita thiersii Skay4041]
MVNLNTDILDHIVHLGPVGSVDRSADTFRELGFRVLPGGVHSDGLTSNALVVLADGVYLELISFNYPVAHYPAGSPERQKREEHRWAGKALGWVDYAFLGNGSMENRVSAVINGRAGRDGSGVRYLEEREGGRIRTDGERLEWLITAPAEEGREQEEGSALLPFFCGDVTPRRLRVPTEPDSNTRHPSGAIGIAFIRVLSTAELLRTLVNRLTTVVGDQAQQHSESEFVWKIQGALVEGKKYIKLVVSLPRGEEEEAFVGKMLVGIYEIGVYVGDAEWVGCKMTPYGKLTMVRQK